MPKVRTVPGKHTMPATLTKLFMRMKNLRMKILRANL
jgi:hypothetical protein